MNLVPMPAPVYKYFDNPEFANALATEGSVKVGTLSEYRAMEGADQERGDRCEGELTLQSPPGRHAYGGDPTSLPPPLRNPAIQISPGAFVTEGEGALTIHSRICELLIYCTSEIYDRDYGRRFANGNRVDCVQINQPEQFVLALDTALRSAMSRKGVTLSQPRWGRCEYRDRRHNWEQDDLPATCLLKPTKYQGQREIRVYWKPTPMQPLDFVVLKVPAIIPYCTLIPAGCA